MSTIVLMSPHQDKRERIIDYTEANGYDSGSYVFENGLRKVKPYFYTYQV